MPYDPLAATVDAAPTGYGTCPNCHAAIPYYLPVEPLYDLDVAATLIPMSELALRQHLSRHKSDFPRRYRKSETARYHRMLTAEEIRRIRAAVFRFEDADEWPREPTATGA